MNSSVRLLPIWRMQVQSMRNNLRYDRRMWIGLLFTGLFSIGGGIWSGLHLLVAVQEWQILGDQALQTGLWNCCLGIWSGISFFTAIALQRRLGSDEVILLFTLPISPAVRFRALLGTFCLENLWIPMLFQGCLMASVLIDALGWQALPWLLLIQIGLLLSVICVVTVLLAVMYLLFVKINLKLAFLIGGGLLVLLLVGGVQYAIHADELKRFLLFWARPEVALILFVCLLLLAWGPAAQPLGRLYTTVFLIVQGKDRGSRTFMLPGLTVLVRMVQKRRTPEAGLWAKALLNQSRNWFFWGRLLATWSLLLLFPFVRTTAILYQIGFSDASLIASYTATLAVLHILETAPGAISSEGNRLALYLTAPIALPRLLWMKLSLYLWPVLLEGLLMGILLAWQFHLSLGQLFYCMIMISLITLGATTLLVWGSAWDADLNLSVEGVIDVLLQEEGPFSPHKMIVLNTTVAFIGGIWLLLWKMPFYSLAGLLAVLDLLLMWIMWHLSLRCLHALSS